MYAAICDHYRMQPTRNNPGVAHENGSVESSHGYFKRRLCQALYRRGSFEFESMAQYQAFIEAVIARLNAKCAQKFELERPRLQSLPHYRTADYEILNSRVSVHSTISVRCILYSVPSRLIGQQLTLHLYHDQIVGFVGTTQVVELPRLHVHGSSTIRRARCINYRHVVESLRQKPRAFLHCQWQEDLLPDADWRELWQQMKRDTEPNTAARWIVEALYIAATQDQEVEVASYLKTELAAGTFTLPRLQHRFNLMKSLPVPEVASVQHELSSYDQLFQPQSSTPLESLRDPDDGAQTPQAQPQIGRAHV